MHPVLFKIGNFPIGTYGLLLTLAFLGAMALSMRLGKRDQLVPDSLSDLAITVLIGGVVGAKLLMIVVDLFKGAPLSQVFDLGTLRAGGVVHGGIILGLAAFLWRIRALKMPLRPTLDALTPGVALGQAIGRLGCFFAGCCYGSECHAPWAVTFTSPDAANFSGTPLDSPIHPVQLYNTLSNLTIMTVLLLLGRRRKFQGQVGACYFILEGLGRIITETWRGDLDRGIGLLGFSWLSTGRLSGFIFILIGITMGAWFRLQKDPEQVRS